MSEDVAKIADGLTEEERRIIAEMSNGEVVSPTACIAADAGVPIKEVRKILKAFRAQGFAVYGPLLDLDDGHPVGSGTWLTGLGVKIQAHLLANPTRQSEDSRS